MVSTKISLENNQKEIHWWQFPLADFSIKLNNNFKRKFFDLVYKERNKSLNLASYINKVSNKYRSSLNYKKQRALLWAHKKQSEFVPAWLIYELANYLKIDLKKIEKNIIAYTSFRGRITVIKPKLPVKITPYFTSLLIHMICDGTVRPNVFFYFQKNKKGLKRFVNIVKEVFGKYNTNPKRGHTVPLIFKKIISNYFVIYDFTSFNSEIPKKLFTLSKQHRVSAITSFLFDDGSSMGKICFYSSSLRTIKGLKKLCESLNYEPKKIGVRLPSNKNKLTGKHYRFSLLDSSKERVYNDFKELFNKFPPLNIGKKFDNIGRDIIVKKRKWKQRGKKETKQILLSSLKKGSKTAYELADIANISLWTTYHHLQDLTKAHKIKKHKLKRKFFYRLL